VLHTTRVLGTWGVTYTKVLLPADALDWPADRIGSSSHTNSRVRRGDWIVIGRGSAVRGLWFNRSSGLRRRLRLESERRVTTGADDGR
jgi:hypothetical protein